MTKIHASCLLAALLCACTTTELDTSIALRSTAEDMPPPPPLSLPHGAGGALARKQAVLYLQVEVIDQTRDPEMKFSVGALAAAKAELEALMPRMKRFTVYSVFNDGAKRLVRDLTDIGEMDGGAASRLPAADALLNVTLTLNCEKAKMSGKGAGDHTLDEIRRYRETLVYNLTDRNGRILDDTPEASGELYDELRRDVGRLVNLQSGKVEYAAGFDPSDEASQAAIVREMTQKLNVGLSARLALAIPLTADVTAINPTGTAFSFSKGSRHGVYRGGEVVVWARTGDFDYVIADTVSEPTADRATLKVVRWNTDDPEAARIVQELRNQPDAVKRHQLFGTTKSIPVKEQVVEK
jgi:hypothetical protein